MRVLGCARPVIAIALCAALAACQHDWPRAGAGGLAERDGWTDEELAGIADRLESAKRTGALRPGRISVAEERLVMAQRETISRLDVDAEESALQAEILAGGAKSAGLAAPSCLKPPCN